MIIRTIFKFIFYRVWGWRIEGEFPKDIPKYIAIGAPHTSNWDFILGLFSRTIQGADIKFIAKKSLFKFPYGWFFRMVGGYPINRTKRSNYVDSIINIFNAHEKFALAITPEGTRKKVAQFKTGFYHIAMGANIPMVITIFDYGNKIFKIIPPIMPSGDYEEDLEIILPYFRGVKGYVPENGVFF